MTETFNSKIDRTTQLGRGGAPVGEVRDISLLLGPYRSGKTLQLIDELIDFCRQQPLMKALVVVPSQRYRTLLEKRVCDGTIETVWRSNRYCRVADRSLSTKRANLFCASSVCRFCSCPEQVRVAVISRVVATFGPRREDSDSCTNHRFFRHACGAFGID